jgi:hypothetical protein
VRGGCQVVRSSTKIWGTLDAHEAWQHSAQGWRWRWLIRSPWRGMDEVRYSIGDRENHFSIPRLLLARFVTRRTFFAGWGIWNSLTGSKLRCRMSQLPVHNHSRLFPLLFSFSPLPRPVILMSAHFASLSSILILSNCSQTTPPRLHHPGR